MRPRTPLRAIAVGSLTLASGVLAGAAQATEITGSWTGTIEAHGTNVSGSETYTADITVRFLGTADVVQLESGGLYWSADATWSDHSRRTGTVFGCPYSASIDSTGTSREGGFVAFWHISDLPANSEGPEWQYAIQHHLNSGPWEGQILPPCPPGPLFPDLNVASVGTPLLPLPSRSTTTSSGSTTAFGITTTWQMTREPDRDCDGIPNTQDQADGSGCPDDGGGAGPGPTDPPVVCSLLVGERYECLFEVVCPAAADCHGEVKVRAPTIAAAGVKGKVGSVARKRLPNFGAGNVSIPAGENERVTLRLTKKGKKLVEAATTGKNRKRKLSGKLTITGTNPSEDKVTIKLSKR